VFHDDSDFLVYMRVLKQACTSREVCIWCYALMTNHVHLVAVPRTENGLSKVLQNAHTAYATYFNSKYGFCGHLWQSRPQISVMDEEYTWTAIRYIERNPVRAGMVSRAEDYLWSSAAAHCGLREDLLLSPDFPPPGMITDWSKWLEIDPSEGQKRAIREHLSTGRPWCKPEELARLERITGRKLHRSLP
jgi:putative transposase